MVIDARIRYTKKAVRESFVKHLQCKPLNKITVKEICEDANINRATFYRHYTDTFDLVLEIEEEIIEKLTRAVEESPEGKIDIVIFKILQSLLDNGPLYGRLFSEEGDPSFPKKVIAVCLTNLKAYIDLELSHLNETEKQWLYEYIGQGCSGIIKQWSETGMKDDPRDIADFIQRLVEVTVLKI